MSFVIVDRERLVNILLGIEDLKGNLFDHNNYGLCMLLFLCGIITVMIML